MLAVPFCMLRVIPSCREGPGGVLPSKIRTAVGKSLTLLAAFKAAVRTDGEGTRSYAKALLRFRCLNCQIIPQSGGRSSNVSVHTWSSKTSCTWSNSFSYLFIHGPNLAIVDPYEWCFSCAGTCSNELWCRGQGQLNVTYLAVNSSKLSSW